MSQLQQPEKIKTRPVQLKSADGTVTLMRAEEVLRFFRRATRRPKEAPVFFGELLYFIRRDRHFEISEADTERLEKLCAG